MYWLGFAPIGKEYIQTYHLLNSGDNIGEQCLSRKDKRKLLIKMIVVFNI